MLMRSWSSMSGMTPIADRNNRYIIIIIIIIIIIAMTYMQGIYNYIPETNHVSRVHNVAAVLHLQSVLHVMLFRSRNMLC